MAKKSIYEKVDQQYRAFVKAWYAVEDANLKQHATDEQMAAAWEKFWGEWFVCKADDLPQFVDLMLALNERGVPVAYISFDDPVMDDKSAEVRLEDLIANCCCFWLSKAADSDDAIEAKLRTAFEKGLKRARKIKFEG